MYILGISAYYHDSAAALIKDGEIMSAAQEERFTRKKHDSSFPTNAIEYCLNEAGLNLAQVDYISYYEKPFIKFERLVETYIAEAPRGIASFMMASPIWLNEKLFLKDTLLKELHALSGIDKKYILPKLLFSEHHQSHAASAFYPSPYQKAAILTIDGVGEWVTTGLAYGDGNKINIIKEIHFPHSLGLFYSAFTYYMGFKVNSGEYKVMELAPYGEPKYVDLIKEHLIDINEDGSFRLNMEYFNFTVGLTMTNKKFNNLFGGAPRQRESPIQQREMDLARSVQDVTEEVMTKLARHAVEVTGCNKLCMAGGVALNCVVNGKLHREEFLDDIWIQPAAGDAGGAIGVALSAYYEHLNMERHVQATNTDAMKGSYLGPKYESNEIRTYLDSVGAAYHELNDEATLLLSVARELANEKVIGWHQGRMEFGPRALGARSIIGDARSQTIQSTMNLKIKYRESFRPFAPSVLNERVKDYFEIDRESPYMLLVAPVSYTIRKAMNKGEERLQGIEKLHVCRSDIPAVTHVDYSARIQTVHQDTNPRYYNLIKKFEELTGSSVIVNTSFNVRGEPIVCSPEDSYRCFMRTDMDVLVIENFLMFKDEQIEYSEATSW
jgi:carbamoyltransferase